MRRKLTTIKYFLLIALSIFIGGVSHFAYAVGNQITIGVSVVADVTPPSIPTGLGATAISSSQIDLAWTASTDNIAVGGYVVRRGGVVVGTTTSVTYSDTGLTASTLYAYTVEAFDTTINYSGQTGSASATTLSGGGGGGGDTTAPTIITYSPVNNSTGISSTTPLTVTFNETVSKATGNIVIRRFADATIFETIAVAGAQVTLLGTVATIVTTLPLESSTQYYVEMDAGTFIDQSSNAFAGISGNVTWVFTTFDTVAPVISSVSSSATYNNATITFSTSESALSTLSWGTTTAYAMGTASEVGYSLPHSIGIAGLSTSTVYYFSISAVDPSSNVSTLYTGTFTTQTPPPPPDTTAPANPSGLSATPSFTTIALSWTNPTDVDFQAVRVMRLTTGYPANSSDGILVYDGALQAFTDTGLSEGTTYYYTAFARDTSANYSSGAITTATTQVTIVPPPPPPPGGDGGGGGGDASTTPPLPPPVVPPVLPPPGGSTTSLPIFPPITSTSTGPFTNFPITGTPSAALQKITISDFIFTQIGDIEEVLPLRSGVVRTDAEKNIRVSISYGKLPDVLKTIAIGIEDPQSGKVSGYLINVNTSKTAYEGVIPAFNKSGKYSFTISILDHDKQGIVRVSGVFDAFLRPRAPSIVPSGVTEAINQAIETIGTPVNAIAPIATPIGVAVGASQAVLLATNVGSVYDVYLLLLKLIGLLTGLFRKKRHEPWGVVYDSVTKRPLDPAYVVAQINKTQQSKGEAITDLDGRYGFLLNPGEYVIVANKTHYKFPSDKLKGRARDEFYENLYFGDPFQVREGGAVTYNIPLDPMEFDWNEFAKNKDNVFQVYSKKKNIRLWIFNGIFYVGMVFSVLSLFVSPTFVNMFVVAVYVGIAGFQIFWRATHKVTRVINKTTGNAIPFALIKVWLPGLNKVVRKTVADETGKFYFLVQPGTYYITVEEKLPDGTYHEVLRTVEQELKSGVVKGDFMV